MNNERSLLAISDDNHTPVLTLLRSNGWNPVVVADAKAAEHALKGERFLVGLLLQPHMDEAYCAQADALLRAHDRLAWIAVSERTSTRLPACRDLFIDHCFDHHSLPLDPARLLMTLGHAHGQASLRHQRGDDPASVDGTPIIGRSAAAAQQWRQILRIAKVDAPVLVCGESGTGKELAARAIHEASTRAEGPFVAVNCAAIQASLIQSELFGYSRGAFSGALRDKRGFFECADHGTLFLDEIGDLPAELQINLLRFLQEGTITPVGSTRDIGVDVRVIAATNVDIAAAVTAGTFREDLFYRLNVLPLNVPPLRERREDIAALAQHFFKQYTHEKHPRLRGFTSHAIAAMEAYPWPGNVRELINCVRRAMVMADGRHITPHDLALPEPDAGGHHEGLAETRTRAERSAIFVSLQNAGKNVTQAAKQLGVSRMTLYRLMAKHGIVN